MTRYKGDPRWINARFAGHCSQCISDSGIDTYFAKGELVFWYPGTKTVLAKACGHAESAANDFEDAAFDEDFAGGAL